MTGAGSRAKATEEFWANLARIQRYEDKIVEAIRALADVLDDPNLGTYEPQRQALRDALKWLEIEVTCGDCIEGRCHWGGAPPALYNEPCGCARHEISVETRARRARAR